CNYIQSHCSITIAFFNFLIHFNFSDCGAAKHFKHSSESLAWSVFPSQLIDYNSLYPYPLFSVFSILSMPLLHSFFLFHSLSPFLLSLSLSPCFSLSPSLLLALSLSLCLCVVHV